MQENFKKSSPPRRRKFIRGIFLLLVFYTVVGFFLLPPIVRVVTVKKLSKQLGREVSIEKIKINPFVFSMTIRGLVIKEKNGQPFVSWGEVYVNFQPTSIFDKAWTFKEISTSKPFVHIKINEDGQFNFSDIIANFSTNAASSKPKTESKPLAVRIERLRIDGANLDFENRLAATNSTVATEKIETTNSVDENLSLLRSVTNAIATLLNSTNQFIGTLDDLEMTNGAVHFEDWANLRPAKLDLSNITLAAKNISNLPVTNLTSELSLRWNKNGSAKVTTTASFSPLTADVQLDLDRIDVGTLDPYLEPKLDLLILSSEIGLHGKVCLRTPENQLPEMSFSGDARLDDFHTVDGVMGQDLLKWDSLRVSGIDVNVNPETVAIKKISVDNVYARLIIETNKTINLLNALRMTNAPATNQVKTVVAKKSAATPVVSTNENAMLPKISVGAIAISNAVIRFTDRSLSPDVNLQIQRADGTISGISSEQLQHADVDLHAVVDGVGPVAITGVINPFSGTLTNKIKISIKNVDLTPTGSYSGKFAGYSIAEGKLSLDLTYEIVGKKLDSKNVITLDRFTFGEKVNSPDATHLPVRLAIAILKDRDGKIVLDVPVEGNLDDPKFRIGKVVKRAIVNILEKVATSPFALLGAAFGGGGEELSYQDFAPGGTNLTADDTKKLDVLAKALYERPGLNLEISGSIDPGGDREGLQRIALDREIREKIWLKLRKSERATNSVEQIFISPDERATWIEKLYGEAVASGQITPQLIAANTNLAAYAASVLPKKQIPKGAAMLVNATKSQTKQTSAATSAYKTKLVPAPDPMEALLLATFSVGENDLKILADNRAKTVQDYFLQIGKVGASRLFLKEGKVESLRSDGSRVYLQLQ